MHVVPDAGAIPGLVVRTEQLQPRPAAQGCGEGERVLVTQGSVAKGWFTDGGAVVDALVVGSLDPTGDSARSSAGGGKAAPKGKSKEA